MAGQPISPSPRVYERPPRRGIYILDGHAVVEADSATWERWFPTADRVVAQTEVDAATWVSTVFTGIDRDLNPDRPAVFETEVIRAADDPVDRLRQHYPTWDDARCGHECVVAELEAANRRNDDA